ncbi:hypothetical protein A0257_07050 [Hymenobacter psoromatis]|nr:hypothetical protein A0257_07050 [Hymenobacter psoromatis]
MPFSYPPRARWPTLYQKFKRVYDKQVDGTGLAVFRIVFSLVLLAEVLHLFYFRHLVFDVIPFLETGEIGFTTPLLLWMMTLALLVLGLFTGPAALVNYGFCLVFFSSLKTYAYMMTPVYISMSFLFLFLPLSRRLSLDRLRLQLRYSTTRFCYQPPTTVSQLAYYAPIVLGLAFVYLDSTLYKLTSPMWLAGLGMWKTLSLPYETRLNGSFILNNEFLVKFLGYLTLAFEFFFIFLFPWRKYRLVVLTIGVGLHLGILLLFPFPLFAIGFGSLYLLLVPAGCWQRLRPAATAGLRPLARLLRLPGIRGFFAPAFPTPGEAGQLPPGEARRDFKPAGAALGLAGLVLLQGLASYQTPLVELLRRKSGLDGTWAGRGLARVSAATAGPARNFFGITNHPIALDEHFAGYTRLVAVTYTGPDGVEQFLPLTRPSGQPGAYLSGAVWLKWTYGTVSGRISQPRLEASLRSFTAFWAHQHQVDLTSCRFQVKVKKIAEATTWQPDFLNQQLAAGWQDAGTVQWHNQHFTAHLAAISSL